MTGMKYERIERYLLFEKGMCRQYLYMLQIVKSVIFHIYAPIFANPENQKYNCQLNFPKLIRGSLQYTWNQ